MLGLEVALAGAVLYAIKRKKEGNAVVGKCGRDDGPVVVDFHSDRMNPATVRRRLEELASEYRPGDEDQLGVEDEEEIFIASEFGPHFNSMVYVDEAIAAVSVYEEVVKQRKVMPIIHPYVLVETARWVYVLEKWQDGLTVLRFRDKELAITSRGKGFAKGRQSQRRMPHLLQYTSEVEDFSMTDLLTWAMDNSDFKTYTDNCHTFAANLCLKCNMKSFNYKLEEIWYKKY